MFELSVEAEFAAAHALRGYQGKCENLHGHNYKVQLTVEGSELDAIGLVCDFKELKRMLRDVLGRLDHQHLNDVGPFRETNPTTEILARYIYNELSPQIAALTEAHANLKCVRVWETQGCSAAYFQLV